MRWYEALLVIGVIVGIYRAYTSGRNGEKGGSGGASPRQGADPERSADPEERRVADPERSADPEVVTSEARGLMARREYSGCLELLEGLPVEVLADSHIVKYVIIKLVKSIQSHNLTDSEFKEAVGPYERRILDLLDSVCRAKSLDVTIDRSQSKYHSLLDYASRVALGQESMLDNPAFWPWLDRNYPHVSRFLRIDEGRIKNTNTFIHMLSGQFKSRNQPRVATHMRWVDSICREVMEACPAHTSSYAAKADESYSTAKVEMVVLVAISRHFKLGRIDPEIPGSSRLADMTFEHEGAEHYVEVYSHKSYAAAAPQVKRGIKPEKEWAARFKKAQIESLKAAGVPTVYVMRLDDSQAMRGETRSEAFREAAAKAMPEDSDIVVITHGVEVASVRGGRVVEPSGLVVKLGKAIAEAMPGWPPGD